MKMRGNNSLKMPSKGNALITNPQKNHFVRQEIQINKKKAKLSIFFLNRELINKS